VLIVDFVLTLKPEAIGGFLTVLAPQELPATRSWDGNEGLTLFQDADDPRRMVLQMRWRTRTDFDSYLQWRQSTGFVEELVKMSVQQPHWEMLNAIIHM
jgi:quinol monooxygenase YgiN